MRESIRSHICMNHPSNRWLSAPRHPRVQSKRFRIPKLSYRAIFGGRNTHSGLGLEPSRLTYWSSTAGAKSVSSSSLRVDMPGIEVTIDIT
eukprot:1387125-Amorphochlora_amoeboformis.AAC.3